MLTEPEIAEIEARADAATQGPWTLEKGFICSGGYQDGVSIAVRLMRLDTDPFAGDDGPFIAHSRTDIPRLLETIRELQEELKIAREQQ